VDVLSNSTSKDTNKFHGYNKETRPHLSIQSKGKISQDVTFLGLVQEELGLDARSVRVAILKVT
jgi:hypothetical protein